MAIFLREANHSAENSRHLGVDEPDSSFLSMCLLRAETSNFPQLLSTSS